jgi:hypothetical protein
MTRTGHRLDRNPAAQQSPAILRCAILWVGSTEVSGSETAPVHDAARRRGGVAARSAGSAAGDDQTLYRMPRVKAGPMGERARQAS